MLAVIQTHPVHYHAPVYRALQTKYGIPVVAIYGSDFSVTGYRDRDFGEKFAWDTDLLTGYSQIFLSRVSHGGASSFDEVSARGLGKALREVRPKAVLIKGYRTRFNQMAIYEAMRTRRPILFRGETTDHDQNRTAVRTLARDTLLRLYYQRVARLLYIGKHSFQHYKRLNCRDEQLIFSPYCIDVSSFEVDERSRSRMRMAAREKIGVGGDQIVLLFAGKLTRLKAPDLLLGAVKKLSPRIREKIAVLFLGSGQLINELKRQALESPQVRIFCPGFQNQSQLSQYYHAADLMVLPSRGEPWGLVVNEALHHGVPCVVSDKVGCAPDLIESGVTGYTFESGSSLSLALVLDRAIGMIGRDDVRMNCRQKVSGYGVEEAAKGIAKAYSQVVGNE
jgi:glycosyltransferase involved in cell wall biosynthesis